MWVLQWRRGLFIVKCELNIEIFRLTERKTRVWSLQMSSLLPNYRITYNSTETLYGPFQRVIYKPNLT